MSYGRHINHDYGYYIEESETCNTLQKVKTTNDLGITFDMHLKFDEHIYAKINNAYMLGILKCNFRTI
jgi:hypothetical protein